MEAMVIYRIRKKIRRNNMPVGIDGNTVIYDYAARETERLDACGCPRDMQEARNWVRWAYSDFSNASDKDVDGLIKFLRKH